jgi:hypothetical protein
MKHGKLRSLAMSLVTIAVALLIGFGIIEATLRAFPSLIGLNQLQNFEPSMRAEIAERLGLPTLVSAVLITSAERTDHGPPFPLSAPNAIGFTFMDKADVALGAPEHVRMDANGLCNPLEKAPLGKADILVAGDSFTTCQGAAPQVGASQKLQDLTGLSTYNLGIGNTGPYEYLEMLKRFAHFKPRLAVMNIYEGNDLRDIVRYRRFVESGGTTEKDRELPSPAWSYAAQFFKTAYKLIEASVKSTVTSSQDYNFRYSAPVGDHVMAMNISNKDQGEVERAIQLRDGKISTDLFAEPLRNYVDWAKANGIVPVVTYIPSMYTAYEGSVTFEDLEVGKTVQAFSAAQRKWLAEHAQSIGYNFLDLTPVLQETAAKGIITHFPSNVHLTAKGEEVVGTRTAEFVKTLGVATP